MKKKEKKKGKAKKKVTAKKIASKTKKKPKTAIKKKEAKRVKAKVKEKKPVKKAVKKKPKKVKAKIKKPAKRVAIQPPMPWEALPAEYGEDSITLMTVDPRKLFTYWEVRKDALASYPGILNIRVYDVTAVDFDGTNANSYFDIAVNEAIGSGYIDVSPAKEFIADFGVISPKGIFIIIARSNRVSTPRAEIVVEEIEKSILPRQLYKTDLPIGY